MTWAPVIFQLSDIQVVTWNLWKSTIDITAGTDTLFYFLSFVYDLGDLVIVCDQCRSCLLYTSDAADD